MEDCTSESVCVCVCASVRAHIFLCVSMCVRVCVSAQSPEVGRVVWRASRKVAVYF